MNIRFAIFIFCFLMTGSYAAPIDASIINLIASPQQFNSKQIRIVGYVRLELEGNAVYLNRDDFSEGIRKNGLWLDVETMSPAQLTNINGRYALVEGTFSMGDRGHLGMWSGAITKITRIEALHPR